VGAVIDEHQVHVGAVVQLAGAELSHRDDGERQLIGDRGKLGGDLFAGDGECAGNQRVGNGGDPGYRLLEARPAGQIQPGDAQVLPPLQTADCPDRRLGVVGRPDCLFGLVGVVAGSREGVRAGQEGVELRLSGQHVGEEGTRRKQEEQISEEAWVVQEQGKRHRRGNQVRAPALETCQGAARLGGVP
jgi:hypothetical protein